MSDSRSAIYDDEDEYLDLCRRYGEAVQYVVVGSKMMTACYGTHHQSLRALASSEAKKK